jgi:hypothetical protein
VVDKTGIVNIDKLDAGRELDALVAERVMGWKNLEYYPAISGRKPGYAPAGWYGDGPNGEVYLNRYYSTRIKDAWLVIEKLINDGNCPGLLYDDNGHWALALEGTQNVPIGDNAQDIATQFFVSANDWAESAPLAICRAALKAVTTL